MSFTPRNPRVARAPEATVKALLVCGAKSRAKKAGLPFDISVASLEWPEVCPVLGIPIIYKKWGSSETGRHTDNSPSLDQISPRKGYTTNNVRVISWRANILKNNGTAAEHRAIAEYIDRSVSKWYIPHSN